MLTKLAGGVLLAMQMSISWAQSAAPHTTHDKSSMKPAESRPAAVADSVYRSPFADYRRFTADEPLKDWRRANDEVRDAGGHVGLLKGGEPAQLKGHGAHGAKQDVPPAADKK